jgi:hypothetical protein
MFEPQTIVDKKTRGLFGVGVDREDSDANVRDSWSRRRQQLYTMLSSWERKKIVRKKLNEMKWKMTIEARAKGLLE